MSARLRQVLRSLGPTVIVAAVVCGPGSVLTASKVGAAHGFSLAWVLALACVLMAGMVSLAGHLGDRLERTLCGELAARLGRPVAAVIGVVVFLVVSAFQSSNNIAVLGAAEGLGFDVAGWGRIALLVAVNGAVLWALYASGDVYRHVERLMKALVVVMVVAFFANAAVARPPLGSLLGGFVPRWPSDGTAGGSQLWEVLALVATTFSIGAAFYQGYLVREKRAVSGGAPQKRTIDTVVGVGVLGLITLVVMATAAAAFHGRDSAVALDSFADVAAQ
ncbi:MAG TPA: divalent metal cation transporter, partial [Acidimicrobiia bacterium]|nr:divalent metal cation transporter [Acidimicrobiia bacterium]